MATYKRTQFDRRSVLLGGLSLAGGALAAPLARGGARDAGEDRDGEAPILVLIELAGGNDGLNTLVPYTDDAYYSLRPRLAIPRDRVAPLTAELGLNHRLRQLRRLYGQGHVAIVRGVGYPDPVYSHFKSFEVWHTADARGRAAGDGWVARLRAAAWGADTRPELIVNVGSELPYSLHSSTHGIVSFGVPEKFLWIGDDRGRASYEAAAAQASTVDEASSAPREAVLARLYRTLRQSQSTSPRVLDAAASYAPSIEYPGGEFGASLRTIAALIEARLGTRVFSAQLRGFDTHAGQNRRQGELLAELDAGLGVFVDDLAGRSTSRNVVIVVSSEFGRRVQENESRGTDHGSAGLTFVLGERVRGGLYGEQPSLTDLDANGNQHFNVDFRSIYATLIEDRFGVSQTAVLGREYPLLPLFEA